MKTMLLVLLGGAAALGGVLMARGRQPACPDILVVGMLVDDCFAGDRKACALLDRTVSAACLMDRAFEATEAKRRRLPNASAEIVL